MNAKKAKQQRRAIAANRMKLVAKLAEYWLHRLHSGLSEQEAIERMTELYLKLEAMSDRELEQMRVATVQDVERMTAQQQQVQHA